MLKRYNVNGVAVIASSYSEAFNRSLAKPTASGLHEVKAEFVDFGDDEVEVDVNTFVSFVVPEDANVKPLLKLLNRKGLLVVNFTEGVESPAVSVVHEPKNRKLTEKKSGGYKLIKIADDSEATVKALEKTLGDIQDAQALVDNLSLVLVGYDGVAESAKLDFTISSVDKG